MTKGEGIGMNNRSGIAYDDSHLGPNASFLAHSISSRTKRSIMSCQPYSATQIQTWLPESHLVRVNY